MFYYIIISTFFQSSGAAQQSFHVFPGNCRSTPWGISVPDWDLLYSITEILYIIQTTTCVCKNPPCWCVLEPDTKSPSASGVLLSPWPWSLTSLERVQERKGNFATAMNNVSHFYYTFTLPTNLYRPACNVNQLQMDNNNGSGVRCAPQTSKLTWIQWI